MGSQAAGHDWTTIESEEKSWKYIQKKDALFFKTKSYFSAEIMETKWWNDSFKKLKEDNRQFRIPCLVKISF